MAHRFLNTTNRRKTLKRTNAFSEQTFDLWILRFLCNAGIWEEIDTSSMGNNDEYSGFSWFEDFRDELNWALAVYLNAEFLETGRVDQMACKLEGGSLVRKPAFAGKADQRVIKREDRLPFLKQSLEKILDEAGDLLDLSKEAPNPDTIGEFWRRICRGGVIRKYLGAEEPQSIFKALERTSRLVADEIGCLSKPMADNLGEIRQAFGLSELDTRIFAFFLAASTRGSDFEPFMRRFDFSRNATDLIIDLTAEALGEDCSVIEEHVRTDSALMRSGLVAFEDSSDDEIFDRFRFLDESRFRSLLSTRIPLPRLLESTIVQAPEAELTIDDYAHLPVVRRVLVPYFKEAIASRRKGANILLYGMPGTGKTQLSRAVCRELNVMLYEVSTDKEKRRCNSRLQCWQTASAFLGGSENTALAIDEAEDVFNDDGDGSPILSFFGVPAPRTNKGQINKLLETNPVPTFWITNSIRSIDPAMIRRFDMVLEVPTPDVTGRRKIVEDAFGGKLSENTVARLTQTDKLAPAVLCRTAAVASMAGFEKGNITEEDVVGLLNETLRAQNFGAVPGSAAVLPPFYDPSYVNCDVNLVELAEGLKEAGEGRLCLYGPPGTGKSAYAAWLAKMLGRPFVRKTAAELTSCYVGVTEKLIAEAFRSAQREHAVLLIDEADSFLLDRKGSRFSWETTQVNEMLAQMEAYSGYFIATTNLLETLDGASLRRFDLKAKFDYLRPEQAVNLAQKLLAENDITLEGCDAARLSGLKALTPGDFAAVRRQARFRPYHSAAEFLARLAGELEVKKGGSASRIGFY